MSTIQHVLEKPRTELPRLFMNNTPTTAEKNPCLIENDFDHDLNMTGQLLSDLRPRNLPPGTRLGWTNWQPLRNSIEGRIVSVLGEFPAHFNGLNAQWGSCVEMPKYTRHEVAFDGEPNERITAIVLIPKGLAGPSPAILCPHGTGSKGRLGGTIPGVAVRSDGTPIDGCQYAWELAERGYITIVWDHFTCGLRAPVGKEYQSSDFEQRRPEWSPMGKMTWDVLRCVDFLATIPEVDFQRIGCIGMSLGGHTTLFGAAFDPRIKVSVAACGFSSFRADRNKRYAWVREEGMFHYMPRLAGYFDDDGDAPFDFHEVAAMVAPRPLLIISGYHDEQVHGTAIMGEFAVRLHDIYDQLGNAEGFMHIHHGQQHSFAKVYREMSYEWLDHWLISG